MNREAIKVFREMGIGRIIFHRKNTVASMRQMIEVVNEDRLEYEAFALNELCQFTGAFCNSLHCDEMGYLCRTAYWGDAEMEERMERAIKRTLETEEQQEQQYLCGKSG